MQAGGVFYCGSLARRGESVEFLAVHHENFTILEFIFRRSDCDRTEARLYVQTQTFSQFEFELKADPRARLLQLSNLILECTRVTNHFPIFNLSVECAGSIALKDLPASFMPYGRGGLTAEALILTSPAAAIAWETHWLWSSLGWLTQPFFSDDRNLSAPRPLRSARSRGPCNQIVPDVPPNLFVSYRQNNTPEVTRSLSGYAKTGEVLFNHTLCSGVGDVHVVLLQQTASKIFEMTVSLVVTESVIAHFCVSYQKLLAVVDQADIQDLLYTMTSRAQRHGVGTGAEQNATVALRRATLQVMTAYLLDHLVVFQLSGMSAPVAHLVAKEGDESGPVEYTTETSTVRMILNSPESTSLKSIEEAPAAATRSKPQPSR